jgi:tRNA A-37 threonylcarbamoyl transferase component Bud32
VAPDGPHPPGSASASLAVIGKYALVRVLGKGGQATVYQAFHTALGQQVVLKLGHHPEPEESERGHLLREARILSELSHPGLARVHDFGFHEGRPYLVMEYVQGQTLQQFARSGAPGPRRAAALVAQLARTVGVLHRRGIIHQDLKPANVLIDEQGRPRLLDFGLARLRNAWADDQETSGGTLRYMPPEQALGQADRITPRSDVYALGAVLYELLTGHAPIPRSDFATALMWAQKGEWDRAALARARAPARLRAICARALAASPADRYASADDLARALERFLLLRAVLWPMALALVLTVAALLVWRARPTLPPAVPPPDHPLAVRVFGPPGGRPLIESVPLRAADELRLTLWAPPGLHVSVFRINGKGQPFHLADFPPDADRPLTYPGQGKTAQVVNPPAGTELILALGRTSGPVELAELREWWASGTSWPALPPEAVLRLDRERVWFEQRPRDVVVVHDRMGPVEEVERLLEQFRQQVREQLPYLEGLGYLRRP